MKKLLVSVAVCVAICSAEAQVKILPSGSVGIGTNSVDYQVKLQIEYGGNSIAISPNTNGPCIGGSTERLDFWHPISKWNKVKFKGYSLSSDSTLKTDIIPLTNVTGILKQIKTYSYYFKSDSINNRKKDYGVLAQELENILPELVDTTKGNMFVNYNAFTAILIKGFNEQQTVIDTQQTKINYLQVENTQQQAEIKQLQVENAQQQAEIKILQDIAFGQELDLTELYELRENMEVMQNMVNILWDAVQSCCNGADITRQQDSLNNNRNNNIPIKAVLYQNIPNPFSSNTEISCYVPEINNNAFICIYNLQGVELMSFPITQTGLSTVTVYASALPAGMYLYTLVVDSQIVDTKRMILTK